MKREIFIRLMKPFFLMLFVLFIGEAGWGDTTIVGFNLGINGTATSGIAGNTGVSVFSCNTGGTAAWGGSSVGASNTLWDGAANTDWWYTSFKTTGYVDIYMTYSQKSEATGPKNFQVEWSIDNSFWTPVNGSALVLGSVNYSSPSSNPILPSDCDNKTVVYLRWIKTSTTSVNNGAIASGAKSYIKSIIITGKDPYAPSTQANDIVISSIDATHLNLSWTNGGGNHRILKMNTIKSFTLPVENYNPTPEAGYTGDGPGEVVVYNGTGSDVTISAPLATNTYWFRVFEYRDNGGAKIMYNTAEGSSGNPQMSALETVTLPTVDNGSIKLSSATLGATIGAKVGTISKRGIYWSTSSGFTSSNYEGEAFDELDADGVISFNVTGIARSSTIYFRGFATNETGTALSPESSFSNIPIFTGTGNWSDAARWNVNPDVPGAGSGLNGDAADSPILNGACTLTSDLIICNNLTIGSGKAFTINSSNLVFTINSSKALTVNGILSNSAGTGALVIKSGGSVINGTDGIEASVKCDITGNKWHLISAPVAGETSNMFLHKYLQEHSEVSNQFTDITPTTGSLIPMKGFALWGDESGFEANYVGPLNTGFYTTSLYRTYAGFNSGWNLVGNPFPSSIDWDWATSPGWTKDNLNNAIYIENAGGWAAYVSGVGNNGGSRYIAPGQGFFVNVADVGSGALSMYNDVRVHNATPFFKNTVNDLVRLQVSGNGFIDEAVVRFLPEATAEFDGSYDAYKLFGDADGAAQLYSLGSTPLAINTLPETSTVPVGMRVSTEGVYTIAATEVNGFSAISLEDTKTGTFTDLLKVSYSFSYFPGENEQRFVLHFGSLSISETENSFANIFSYQKTAYINLKGQVKGDIYIYNISGHLVASVLSAHGSNRVDLDNTGNYIVKVIMDNATVVRKVFVK
ncbi:MAG: T9SS type A sorting domain-containing protein [Bacteroidales bacterium]